MKLTTPMLLGLLGLFSPVAALAEVAAEAPNVDWEDSSAVAVPVATIRCPRMHVVAKNDPAVPTNGFNQHIFLVNAPTAKRGQTSAGFFLYCAADSFGGLWMARPEPVG